MIRGRVRRLEADLTSSRRLAEERGAEANRLQRSLDSAATLSAERLETINRLEDDLATAFRSNSGKSGGGGIGGATALGTPRGKGAEVEGTDALRELLGVGGDREARGEGVEAEVDSHGVLGIVQVRVCGRCVLIPAGCGSWVLVGWNTGGTHGAVEFGPISFLLCTCAVPHLPPRRLRR